MGFSLIVAVVGSRKGAVLTDVTAFLTALHRKHPSAVVVSGGAAGVDKTAEQEWLRLGGRVVSLRPRNIPINKFTEEWWVERWMLGGLTERDETISGVPEGVAAQEGKLNEGLRPDRASRSVSPSGVEVLRDVSFADFTSAAVYRDSLIASYADRLVAFQSDPPSNGTTITTGFARSAGKPVYVYSPRERFAAAKETVAA